MLGLFDDYMSLRENRLTSVTKIGGTPTYFPHLLAADGLLSDEQRSQLRSWQRCGVCGADMYLLAQAYAPAPTFALLSPSATSVAPPPHHRMLYVWCCNSSVCSKQPRDSWKAAVIQVDQEDLDAFGEDGEGNRNAEEDEEDEEPYREHPLPRGALPCTHAFPPCHVHVVPEPPFRHGAPFPARPPPTSPSSSTPADLTSEKEELKDLEKKVDLKNTAVDYHFEAFRARIAREPTQVIRYYPASVPDNTTVSVRERKEDQKEQELLNGSHPLFMNPERVIRHFEATTCEGASAKKNGASVKRSQTMAIHTDPSSTSAGETEKPTTLTKEEEMMMMGEEEEEEEDEIELAEEVEHQVNMLHHRPLRHRCTDCGGLLRAECQVLPTSLYYLRPEQYLPPRRQTSSKVAENHSTSGSEDLSVDFGTVTVYTCANWCQAKRPGVVLTEAFLLVEPAPTVQENTDNKKTEGNEAKNNKKKKTDLREFMTSTKPLEDEE